jgi:hypothetical protein
MTTYTFTIKAIGANAEKAQFGHVWFTVAPNDGSSNSRSFGYHLDGIHEDAHEICADLSYSRSWEITQEQYDRLCDFVLDYATGGRHLVQWEACVDFAIKAARAAGVISVDNNGEGGAFPPA